jgi:hypothetical protein
MQLPGTANIVLIIQKLIEAAIGRKNRPALPVGYGRNTLSGEQALALDWNTRKP